MDRLSLVVSIDGLQPEHDARRADPRAEGAGRADILIAGGDVPADPGSVSAVECWGSDFKRSYYTDSVGFEASAGQAAACVYDAP